MTSIEAQINAIDIEINKALETYTKSNPLYLELISQKDTLLAQKMVEQE